MSEVHGPLSSASTLLSVFEGGRSPGCWREQQSRQAEWIGATRRNSCWIEDFRDVDLFLCDQPLLGNTLAALTSRTVRTDTVPAESTTSRAAFSEPAGTGKDHLRQRSDRDGHKVVRPLPSKAPETKRSVSPFSISSNTRSESVLQLQPQADASLLRRIAGQTREFSNDRSARGRETPAGNVRRKSAEASNVAARLKQERFNSPTVAARSASVGLSSPRLSQPELPTFVERVARRIKTILARESARPRELSTKRELEGATDHDLRSFTDHWSTPIAGPSASTALLTCLAKYDRYVDETVEDNSSHALSESHLPATHRSPEAHDSASSVAQTTHALTAITAPAIAPPSVTPALPPLHSHKQDDVVAPVAAVTAQRQARIDEHNARVDDLPLLAERLDRILKQEARRHGIDV